MISDVSGAARAGVEGIAVVVLTYDRVHLLERCVDNVLSKASAMTREIIVWNNGSSDRTRAYLDSIDDPRIRVIHYPTNIGQNAYPEAFSLTTSKYLIELDDDMIDAPPNWDQTLLQAFEVLSTVGFVAASLVDDPNDLSARAMYHVHEYTEVEERGIRLMIGPTGGGCALTSREIYDEVGGFHRNRGRVFFAEDAAYVAAVRRAGYRAVTLADLKLHHAGGPYYSTQPAEKRAFWRSHYRRAQRKLAVKRALVRAPGVNRLNARYQWFRPPEELASTIEEGGRCWLEMES